MWRWDQGRLDYFRFDEIRRVATALTEFDGQRLPSGDGVETLRAVLAAHTALPFAPSHYTVWRNYGRVFGAQFLAAKVGEILVCTEVCRALAETDVGCDEYLLHVFNRFYYPAPFFTGFDPAATKVFPFAALIKLAVAKAQSDDMSGISVEEVVSLLIGNSVTGEEELGSYSKLPATTFTVPDPRQVRELMIFSSQISFLKWANGRLYLDIADPKNAEKILDLIEPFALPYAGSACREILSLGSHFDPGTASVLTPSDAIENAATEFSEGSKIRVTHLRYERSSKLREMFFDLRDHPEICEMCEMDTIQKYPWANRLIEVHHLLPLSSPVRIDGNGTSLADVVGLCPTCHRATHRYYGQWLKREGVKDFRSYEEAYAAYESTKAALC